MGVFLVIVFMGTVFDIPSSKIEHFAKFVNIVLERSIVVIFWVNFSPLEELFVGCNSSDPILKHA
jgi:hypothetical protein